MTLTSRSTEKEFLDSELLSANDLNRNLAELNIINKMLGGYRASTRGFNEILKTHPSVYNVLDIGFGGGDSIFHLSKLAASRNIPVFFVGVDLKEDCLSYAEKKLALVLNKRLICKDYRDISPEMLDDTDIIHCSLFLHHLNDNEIIHLFQMARFHHCILLINDLHRHWLAYQSIRLLTGIFSRSWLVKNDAPISVKRGFRKKELLALLSRSGFTSFSVKWSWPFRYIVIAHK